jgi:hypothetical protein
MPMPPVLQQQAQRRQARVPVPTPPQMRQPQVAMRAPARPQQSRKQQKRRVAPLQQPARSAQALLEEIPRAVESQIGRGAVPASPARRQVAAQPMLRFTAQSIRQQFILAEILQPPLALRDQPIR